MDHLQPAPHMANVVQQVFPTAPSSDKVQNTQLIQLTHASLPSNHEGKLTSYQETMTSDSISVPSSDIEGQRIQSQTMITCEQTQTHLQSLEPVNMQSQILHTELSQHSQPIQFTSHVILPHVPMFKQHLVLEQQYYSQYNTFVKEQRTEDGCGKCVEEPTAVIEMQCEPLNQSTTQMEIQVKPKRSRNRIPDPSSWACNIRKKKHQNGEAYISRRGKYVPERRIKSTKNCLTSCKYKCNKNISDVDRELLFKAFYSLTSNEKKQFLLNTTERNYVKNKVLGNCKRQFTFKYYFLVRGNKYAVCKNFFLGTLAISQKPVYNVHATKSEMNIPKRDGRGLSASSIHGLPATVKDLVRKHIMSFKTLDSTPIKQFSRKKQHLNQNLSMKQMYGMYVSDCNAKNEFVVRESMYRKILKEEFNISFVRNKSEQLCAKCKEPIRKK